MNTKSGHLRFESSPTNCPPVVRTVRQLDDSPKLTAQQVPIAADWAYQPQSCPSCPVFSSGVQEVDGTPSKKRRAHRRQSIENVLDTARPACPGPAKKRRANARPS